MLDISFYSRDQEPSETVEVSEEVYKWLSESEFSKIGKREEKEMKVDEEVVTVSVVLLEGENRRKFSGFFRDAIVQESEKMLTQLSDSLSKKEYLAASDKLKILQALRKLVENEKFKYLAPED